MGKKNKIQEDKDKPTKIYEAFFSGLPYETNEEDIKQFLQSDNAIISIKLPRYQDTNRCLGYAHVKFNSQEAYKNALQKNGKHLGKRYITITQAKGQRQVEQPKSIPVGCKTMFVKGLPYDLKEQDLKGQFGSVGQISDIRMVRNWANKNFKGFAYIQYKQSSNLKKAISKYHNKLYRGRKLICDSSVTQKKNGYKKRDTVKVQQSEERQN